jgi:hypothetical protein
MVVGRVVCSGEVLRVLCGGGIGREAGRGRRGAQGRREGLEEDEEDEAGDRTEDCVEEEIVGEDGYAEGVLLLFSVLAFFPPRRP